MWDLISCMPKFITRIWWLFTVDNTSSMDSWRRAKRRLAKAKQETSTKSWCSKMLQKDKRRSWMTLLSISLVVWKSWKFKRPRCKIGSKSWQKIMMSKSWKSLPGTSIRIWNRVAFKWLLIIIVKSDSIWWKEWITKWTTSWMPSVWLI